MRRLHRAASAAPLLIGAFALGACSTTIDPTATTLPRGETTSTTVFVASGTTTELLDQLVETATGLSETIVQNEGQHDVMARIDTLWEAARPGIEAANPDATLEFDRAIALMHNGVDRRRPADADKALNNFRNLIAALPVTEAQAASPELRGAFTGGKEKGARQAEVEAQWASFARDNYAKAKAKAEEALKAAK